MGNTTNGTIPLTKRLEEPEVVAAINRLLDRIDALENTVETLNLLVKEGPAFTAMATDIIDEKAQQVAADGIHIDERLKNALSIAEKATQDETVEAMTKAIQFVKDAPGFVAMLADIFDEHMRLASSNNIDIEARLKGALQLAIQLTDPAMLDTLQASLSVAVEAPGFAAMITDMVDDQLRGQDVDAKIRSLMSLANKVTDPDTTHALEQVLSPEAVKTVGLLSKALVYGHTHPLKPIGPVGMMKKLRDPDVKKAMGFLLTVAKSLGQELGN